MLIHAEVENKSQAQNLLFRFYCKYFENNFIALLNSDINI